MNFERKCATPIGVEITIAAKKIARLTIEAPRRFMYCSSGVDIHAPNIPPVKNSVCDQCHVFHWTDKKTVNAMTLTEITTRNAQATAAGALSSGQIQLDSRSVGTGPQQQQQQK